MGNRKRKIVNSPKLYTLEIILEAYVTKHVGDCTNPSCPLNTYYKLSRNANKAGKLHANIGTSSKLLLLDHVKTQYKKSLKKFGNSASLRIRYAFYLLEYIENKEAALRQFKKAENYNPAFDESFVIYRYKKILQEGMSHTSTKQSAVGMDVVSTIAYENYYRQCRKSLEKAARLHIEFWRELNTSMPDVEQLMELGTRISKTISEIEDYWGQMQRVNPNAFAAVKMYASFLKEVMGDNDAALELLKTVSSTNAIIKGELKDEEAAKSEFHFTYPYARDGTPCMCISGESRSVGTIRYANKPLYRALGYLENTLTKKSINTIIPSIIAKHHDKFLVNAIEMPDSVTSVGQETLLPCKMASGYITMMYMCLRELPSFINNMHFIATFKPDRGARGREIAYVLLDFNGIVTDASESMILGGKFKIS